MNVILRGAVQPFTGIWFIENVTVTKGLWRYEEKCIPPPFLTHHHLEMLITCKRRCCSLLWCLSAKLLIGRAEKSWNRTYHRHPDDQWGLKASRRRRLGKVPLNRLDGCSWRSTSIYKCLPRTTALNAAASPDSGSCSLGKEYSSWVRGTMQRHCFVILYYTSWKWISVATTVQWWWAALWGGMGLAVW